jgi:prepilin-type N-terminal cleavage/methylation domain-containing protein
MLNRKKAFTLIELVVVMAIIAVLSLIIIAAIQGARRQSIVSQNKGNARTIEIAMESYAAKNGGSYPTGFAAGTDLKTAATFLKGQQVLSTDLSSSCGDTSPTPGGGTIESTTGNGFTITIADYECKTPAGSETITH